MLDPDTKNNSCFKVDENVEAKWQNGDSWIRGTIVKQRGDETYDVMYEFGKSTKEGSVQSWTCPDIGSMSLDFVDKKRLTCASRRPGSRPRSRPSSRRQTVNDMLVKKRTASSTIRYRLDLSLEDDRIMLSQVGCVYAHITATICHLQNRTHRYFVLLVFSLVKIS